MVIAHNIAQVLSANIGPSIYLRDDVLNYNLQLINNEYTSGEASEISLAPIGAKPILSLKLII